MLGQAWAVLHCTPGPLRVTFDRDVASSMSGHVGDAPKSGSNIRVLAPVMTGQWRIDDVIRRVIQTSKLEPRIVRYEFTDHE